VSQARPLTLNKTAATARPLQKFIAPNLARSCGGRDRLRRPGQQVNRENPRPTSPFFLGYLVTSTPPRHPELQKMARDFSTGLRLTRINGRTSHSECEVLRFAQDDPLWLVGAVHRTARGRIRAGLAEPISLSLLHTTARPNRSPFQLCRSPRALHSHIFLLWLVVQSHSHDLSE